MRARGVRRHRSCVRSEQRSSSSAKASASDARPPATRHCSGSSGSTSATVPTLEGVSSTNVRSLLREGDVVGAARLLGRPPEVEGTVVLGDQRGGTLGYPTANLSVPAELLVPAYGIYAGSALGHRAAISIGVNPHYGGDERRDRTAPPRFRRRSLRPAPRRGALAAAAGGASVLERGRAGCSDHARRGGDARGGAPHVSRTERFNHGGHSLEGGKQKRQARVGPRASQFGKSAASQCQ